jgi:hypothetical protein
MSYASKGRTERSVGLDLGDKYSYFYVLDNESGKMIEEGRLRTTPDDLRRRFDSEEQMKIAIEVGTHSSWVSRILHNCEVLSNLVDWVPVTQRPSLRFLLPVARF